jgi:hypothetical protein
MQKLCFSFDKMHLSIAHLMSTLLIFEYSKRESHIKWFNEFNPHILSDNSLFRVSVLERFETYFF